MRRLVLVETILAHFKKTLPANAGSETATMTNAPVTGNPTKWIAYDDNGTTRYIPSW